MLDTRPALSIVRETNSRLICRVTQCGWQLRTCEPSLPNSVETLTEKCCNVQRDRSHHVYVPVVLRRDAVIQAVYYVAPGGRVYAGKKAAARVSHWWSENFEVPKNSDVFLFVHESPFTRQLPSETAAGSTSNWCPVATCSFRKAALGRRGNRWLPGSIARFVPFVEMVVESFKFRKCMQLPEIFRKVQKFCWNILKRKEFIASEDCVLTLPLSDKTCELCDVYLQHWLIWHSCYRLHWNVSVKNIKPVRYR